MPVVIALHGFGGDADWMMDLGFPALLDAVVRDGARPFGYVTVDGGPRSYYHPRADGTDAGAMVIGELLPKLKSAGFDISRLGLCGFSMGGFGALRLAATYRSQVRAAAATAPAVWTRAGDSPPVAFDSADDWRTHGLMADPTVLQGIPLRIDCGLDDPFAPAVRTLRSRLTPTPAGGMSPGGHTADFVRTHLPAQLRFLADRLR